MEKDQCKVLEFFDQRALAGALSTKFIEVAQEPASVPQEPVAATEPVTPESSVVDPEAKKPVLPPAEPEADDIGAITEENIRKDLKFKVLANDEVIVSFSTKKKAAAFIEEAEKKHPDVEFKIA